VADHKDRFRTGSCASQREDYLIKIGRSELYALARATFQTSAFATESTGREPVVFLVTPSTPTVGIPVAPVCGGGDQAPLAQGSTPATSGPAIPGGASTDVEEEVGGVGA